MSSASSTRRVHLCQPNPRTACGACCGMYNVEGAERSEIVQILDERTQTFRRHCRIDDTERLLAFREDRIRLEGPRKLLGLLRNCPFLGVLDEATGRVGCLVHPAVAGLGHEGRDGRAVGVYDEAICEEYLCGAFTVLDDLERSLVIAACDGDSYLYGLVLNDLPLLRGLLTAVADLLGWYPRDERLLAPSVVLAIRSFLQLKVDWPFADPDSGVIGAYLPDGDDDVARRTIDYAALGCTPSRFDAILRSLGSLFDDEDDLREAEALVYAQIHDVATALETLMAQRRASRR